MQRYLKMFWIGGILAFICLMPQKSLAAEYSAKWVAQDEKVTVQAGEIQKSWVEIKNTGSAVWVNSGDNAVKIGTSRKKDRSSALYSSSWLSNNRVVAMQQATVSPGEVARFEFDITGGFNNGERREYFSLVAEGLAWVSESEFWIDVAVLPTTFSAELISAPTPIVLKAGETKTVTAIIKNTGSANWQNTGPYAVKLGTAGPFDRSSAFYGESWLSKNRVISGDQLVGPGGTLELTWVIAAPSKPGDYKEKFALVAEGIAWVKSSTFEIDIKVNPAIYSAELVSKSSDLMLTPGEETILTVELRNKGNTVWSSIGDRAVKLGTSKPLDRESIFYASVWPSENRAAIVEQDTSPEEIGKFMFTIKAPEKIGVYKEYFRPVVEGVTWMEDLNIYWEINVNEELVLITPIRVGLSYINDPVIVTSSAGLVVRAGDDKTLVVRANANQSLTITSTSSGSIINMGGETYTTNTYVKCIPLKDSIITASNVQISSIYNRFRGIITIKRSNLSGRAWVVNELELNDYMKGIAEVPTSWPLEARKAQAVAARTFAVRRIQTPKADIFDIYDDTKDQVYYGYNYEIKTPGIAEAAEATKGIIVKYGGQPALTYYHSDSGGNTDSVEDAWSNGDYSRAVPYLKAVVDPYAKPVVWDANLSQGYLQGAFDEVLAKAGAMSETIVDIIIDERFISGTLKTATLVTSTGKRISVNSTTFRRNTSATYVKSMDFTVNKSGADNAPDFLLSGKGNGHGIGLSQWSAYNMASQGQTYDQILKFFYTGVNVEQI
ncbi:SpoIID/LytB domain-containing protein [Patescibacteria group bacterium]|nr:SpoIID/LytB domain-containing protein [Patescibacteria group bacterium]